MTLSIDLPDDVAAAIRSQAAARGLSVESWLQEPATQHLQSACTTEERKKDLGWLQAAEKSFDFWSNEEDAVYDTL